MITMLLGGLWHGAAVRFILWGGLHGLALALHKAWMTAFPSAKMLGCDMNPIIRIFSTLFTFHVVCLGWLLFRAESMQTVTLMLSQIFTNFNGSLAPQMLLGYSEVFALMAIGYTLHFLPKSFSDTARTAITKSSLPLQIALVAMTIWLVMQVKSSDIQPFIYFQF